MKINKDEYYRMKNELEMLKAKTMENGFMCLNTNVLRYAPNLDTSYIDYSFQLSVFFDFNAIANRKIDIESTLSARDVKILSSTSFASPKERIIEYVNIINNLIEKGFFDKMTIRKHCYESFPIPHDNEENEIEDETKCNDENQLDNKPETHSEEDIVTCITSDTFKNYKYQHATINITHHDSKITEPVLIIPKKQLKEFSEYWKSKVDLMMFLIMINHGNFVDSYQLGGNVEQSNEVPDDTLIITTYSNLEDYFGAFITFEAVMDDYKTVMEYIHNEIPHEYHKDVIKMSIDDDEPKEQKFKRGDYKRITFKVLCPKEFDFRGLLDMTHNNCVGMKDYIDSNILLNGDDGFYMLVDFVNSEDWSGCIKKLQQAYDMFKELFNGEKAKISSFYGVNGDITNDCKYVIFEILYPRDLIIEPLMCKTHKSRIINDYVKHNIIVINDTDDFEMGINLVDYEDGQLPISVLTSTFLKAMIIIINYFRENSESKEGKDETHQSFELNTEKPNSKKEIDDTDTVPIDFDELNNVIRVNIKNVEDNEDYRNKIQYMLSLKSSLNPNASLAFKFIVEYFEAFPFEKIKKFGDAILSAEKTDHNAVKRIMNSLYGMT